MAPVTFPKPGRFIIRSLGDSNYAELLKFTALKQLQLQAILVCSCFSKIRGIMEMALDYKNAIYFFHSFSLGTSPYLPFE